MTAPRHKPQMKTLSTVAPSYARPTAASEGRKALQASSISKSKSQQQAERKERLSAPPPSPRKRNAARPAIMSARKRLGFFDLPAELRNTIYDLANIQSANCRLKFYAGHLRRNLSHAIPALLRADERLLLEAGSYYFCEGRFDILLDQRHTKAFLKWFAAIEQLSQARLARNAGVTIRLVHDTTWCKDNAHHASSTHLKTWRVPAEHVERWGNAPAEVEKAQSRFPVVAMWTLTSECETAVRFWTYDTGKRRPWWAQRDEVHLSKIMDDKTRAKMGCLMERVYQRLALPA